MRADLPFRTQALGLAGWLLAAFAAGGLGAIASSRAAAFYATLARPAWAPPAWLFGPVWSVLYVLMAVAAWRVWRAHGFNGARTSLWLFVAQLVANTLWPWVFFVLRRGALSLAEIAALWLLIAATVVAFWSRDRLAALLLLPYLAWVGYAAALTLSLWRLNPSVLG